MRSLILAPLPRWRDIFNSFFCHTASDEALSLPWRRHEEIAFWHSRSAWSLVVIARSRMQLLEKSTICIWLPDYFCNASLQLLREIGAELIFYPIDEGMAPNMEACRALLERHPIDVFVMVHYFGKPAAPKEVKSFCETNKAWLIEDATHILQPINGVGELGDYVLYSPHKHLPIPDGAVLVLRRDGPSRIIESEEVIEAISDVRKELFSLQKFSYVDNLLWLVKRLIQTLGYRSPAIKRGGQTGGLGFSTRSQDPRMGAMSRRLLSPLLCRLHVIGEKRKEIARIWGEIFAWAVPDLGVNAFHGEEVPYMAAFTLFDDTNRKSIFEDFERIGLPVITWPDLPPEVISNPQGHSIAIKLKAKRFFMPAHQTLTIKQLASYGGRFLDNLTKDWRIKYIAENEWNHSFRECKEANLLQSWQYGDVKKELDGWSPQRILILNENNNPIALAQILMRKIPLIGNIARLNRGPLLMSGSTRSEEIRLKIFALSALLRGLQPQRLLYLRAAPELPNEESPILGLRALDFKKLSSPSWASGRIDLRVEEQALLMSLKSKWRNSLRKSEKLGVSVVRCESSQETIKFLIKNYQDLKDSHGFDGLSSEFIASLAKQQGSQWRFNIFLAHEERLDSAVDNNAIGMLVTINSGRTSLYLIGVCGDKGRQMQANSILLWNAILDAKKAGCEWFDVGGLSDQTPKGIADFKKGLNAIPYELVGEWQWF